PPNMGEVRKQIAELRDGAIAEGKPLYGDAMPAAAPRRRSSRTPFVVGGLAAASLAVVAVASLTRAPRATPAPAPTVVAKPVVEAQPAPKVSHVTVTTNAQATRVFLDKDAEHRETQPAAAGGGTLRVTVPPDTDWILRVEAEGFQTRTMPIRI